MRNTVINGDCLTEMQAIPSGSVDMILCDLPYGTTQCKWDTIIPLDLLWEQYERVIKPKGAIVLTASQPFTSKLIMSNPSLFKYEWIWEKTRPNGFLNANKQPMKKHENVCVFSKGACAYFPQGLVKKDKQNRNTGVENVYGKVNKDWKQDVTYTNYPTSILRFANPTNPVHPTQKPVDLFEYLIKTYTNEGDLVLDNCCGSGTTGIACLRTKRDFILMDMSAVSGILRADEKEVRE